MRQTQRILYVLGQVDDKYIAECTSSKSLARRQFKKSQSIKWCAIAAVFCILIGTTFGLYNSSRDESMTEIRELLDEQETIQTMCYIAVDQYVAIYEQIDLSSEIDVENCIGTLYLEVPTIIGESETELSHLEEFQLSENCSWYKVKGTDDIKYLIREGDTGGYSVWKFESFMVKSSEELDIMYPDSVFQEYKYGTVLRLIYNVDSSEDISLIHVGAATNDNTMEGKNIQATIQEKDIEDSETISNIYQALKDMYCYGRDSAEIQQDTIRSDEIRTAIEENEHNESVFLRYLTITLSDSTVIDDLKYSAIRGVFYEYNGISYSALDDEVMDEVNNYLGIQNLEND